MSALENTVSDPIKVSNLRHNELVESLKNDEKWVAFTDKTPIDPTSGSAAKANDPETWTDFDTARAYADSNDLLVGYALTGTDLTFIDLDGCRDPETEEVEDWALDIINRLDSYTEVSTSGTGLHVIAHGDVDIHSHKALMENQTVDVDKTSEIEVYDDGRFVIFTFDHVTNTPVDIERCNDLKEVYRDYFGEAPNPSETSDFSDVR